MNASRHEELFELARSAYEKAYAPYSKFSVGAAICDNNGNMFAGCNVENAAYPQGLCAEANAIGAMVSAGSREISIVLVMANGEGPVFPCGGCRQKLLEFCAKDCVVLIANPDKITNEIKFSELVPYSFGTETLG